MLTTLRNAAKTKVAGVVIGALVLAFALWGVSDIFRASINNVVARVGNRDLLGPDFDRELRGQMRQLSQQTGTDITVEQAQAMGIDKSVLDNMISRAALDEAIARLGLTASDQAVANEIRSMEGFRGVDGAFSQLAFQQQLRQLGLTEGQYVEATRGDIARGQLLESVAAGIVPPPGLTRLLHDLVNETRGVEYVVLTPADAGAVPEPTDAQLAEFHRSNPDRFSAPEYRSIEYVQIGPDQVAGEVQVSEEELQNEYRTRRASFETPEQRQIEQISFPDKAAADAASARLKSGVTFATIAQERGLKDEDYKLGSLAASGMDARLSRIAFATPEGSVSEPVQGPFGWVIMRVAAITPGVSKTFEEMRETLRNNLVRARSQGEVQDLANTLEDERAGGATLADAAAKLNLPLKRVAAVDNKGLTPDGSKADIPAQPDFLQQVFALEAGDESDPFRTPDDIYYVVKIDGVTPVALRPLASVRDSVREAWLTQARSEAIARRANEIAAAARTRGLAAASGRTPVTAAGIRRAAPHDVLSPALLQQFFGEPVGGVVTGPATTAPNLVVARVSSIQHPPVDPASPDYAQFRAAMGQELTQDLVQTFAASARGEVEVETYPDVMQTALGQTQQ